mgnify:CR=1 FL=1
MLADETLPYDIDQVIWSCSLDQAIGSQAISLKPELAQVITYPGSLTRYFQHKAGSIPVIIELLSQHTRQASYSEAKLLQCAEIDVQITERIIYMSVSNTRWLYARSHFSPDAINYLNKDLKNLGDKPLGLLLIESYPDIIRGNFEYGVINNNIIRRSLYKLDNQILFSLDEIFLPALALIIT